MGGRGSGKGGLTRGAEVAWNWGFFEYNIMLDTHNYLNGGDNQKTFTGPKVWWGAVRGLEIQGSNPG